MSCKFSKYLLDNFLFSKIFEDFLSNFKLSLKIQSLASTNNFASRYSLKHFMRIRTWIQQMINLIFIELSSHNFCFKFPVNHCITSQIFQQIESIDINPWQVIWGLFLLLLTRQKVNRAKMFFSVDKRIVKLEPVKSVVFSWIRFGSGYHVMQNIQRPYVEVHQFG